MNFDAKLIGRETMAGGVAIFRLEKPEGFQFTAGQWCFLSVSPAGHEDDRGLRRPLSIASSPLEKELIFATKLGDSAMKRTMAEMSPGTPVSLGQPMGTMTLPKETATPLVFLAGGIGITPFRSMCLYAAGAKTDHAITLFYSSKTPEETAFLDDLQRVGKEYNPVSVVITMTRAPEDPKAWNGPRGRLSADTIKARCPVWDKASYYIAGPPAMADTMKETLTTLDIPADRIKIELFAGA
jgi:ferredoxin-NADP reductase